MYFLTGLVMYLVALTVGIVLGKSIKLADVMEGCSDD